MAEGAIGTDAGRGGRGTPSIEKSKVPFFAGWQEHASSFSGSSGGRLSGPPTPSPQPSPFTVPPEEGQDRSFLLGGAYRRARVDESRDMAATLQVPGSSREDLENDIPTHVPAQKFPQDVDILTNCSQQTELPCPTAKSYPASGFETPFSGTGRIKFGRRSI